MVPTEVFLTFILMLTIFLGFELINKVPSSLHTPLMSGANAIHGDGALFHQAPCFVLGGDNACPDQLLYQQAPYLY